MYLKYYHVLRDPTLPFQIWSLASLNVLSSSVVSIIGFSYCGITNNEVVKRL